MSATSAALVVAAMQTVLVVLLAADKWVHRVTGPTPLEGQLGQLRTDIASLKGLIADANDRWSRRTSELTVYLEERRSDHEGLRAHVHEIEGELRAMRNYRQEWTPGQPDDRRRP